jgi:hypothetical protein
MESWTIEKFIKSASEYAAIEYEFTLELRGEKDGWTHFDAIYEYVTSKYRARMVTAKIGEEEVALVEVMDDDKRYFVNRPSDLIATLWA